MSSFAGFSTASGHVGAASATAWTGPRGGARGRQPVAIALIVLLHAVLLWLLLSDPSVRALVPEVLPIVVSVVHDAPVQQAALPEPKLIPPPTALPPVAPQWLPPPEVQVLVPRDIAAVAPQPEPPQPVPTPMPAVVTTVAVQPAPVLLQPPPAAPARVPEAPLLNAEQLRFTQAPRVDYPRASRRNKESGVVWVRAWVSSTGGASADVRIDRSSGFVRLDEAALRAVQQARFAPALQDGRPTAGWALIPINFELET